MTSDDWNIFPKQFIAPDPSEPAPLAPMTPLTTAGQSLVDRGIVGPHTAREVERQAADRALAELLTAQVFERHRECGKPYDGCYSHIPMMAHCKADGMIIPCDVMVLAALIDKASTEDSDG